MESKPKVEVVWDPGITSQKLQYPFLQLLTSDLFGSTLFH